MALGGITPMQRLAMAAQRFFYRPLKMGGLPTDRADIAAQGKKHRADAHSLRPADLASDDASEIWVDQIRNTII